MPSLAVDRLLSTRLRAHEHLAFQEVYDQHAPSCIRRAQRVVLAPEIAEDVVQEVFLRLWEKPQAYSPERGGLLSWLQAVTHHCAVDVVRKRTRDSRPRLFDDRSREFATAEGEPETLALAADSARQVRTAIPKLGAAQREVVWLAYYGRHSQTEMSTMLGIPLGTIKTRNRSALHTLASSLKELDPSTQGSRPV